ncbi:hypothetical protein [Brevundimonas sp. NIBR11]|uniref:hypothetical protein n=1 Tax=Brevundimonas sp. NIBR11 TaxID=3015999 RepID=UPI0022F07A6A|nr:hypothetical protein [Brevundimonas sp. NIBR11]WGM32132.1 hypothetical protein KKHFBJBL_02383 [Brevundimonas sp. NIBR11]
MAELSVAQRAVLAQMLERVPDRVLKTLSGAVSQMPGERAAALSIMLADETIDRRRRAIAFAPLLPMFQRRPDGVEALTFPSDVLPRLWKAASSKEPELLLILDDYRPIEDNPKMRAVADRICVAAAGCVRDHPEIVWPSAGADQEARVKGLEELALCFDLATMARRGLLILPDLILRPTGDQMAELRLLIRDSAGVTADGGPRMLEIFFAHLADASLILRLVVHSSKSASKEGLLSESEMAGFVNRLIAEVEARVSRIASYGPGVKADPGPGLRADIAWCAETLGELDITLQLDPDGSWGKQAREARERINATLSRTLKTLDKALDRLMPSREAKLSGRMTRKVPDLEAEAAPLEAVQAAIVQLTLLGALRTAAQVFGCEGLRVQLVQSVTERITAYVDMVIEAVNAGDAPDQRKSLAQVETLAKCLLLIEATEAARTVRRRAAAAGARPSLDAIEDASPRAA